jgi:diguanylate cyclase (GGDEF)-like protein
VKSTRHARARAGQQCVAMPPALPAAMQRIRELETLVAQLREVNLQLTGNKLKMTHLAHHDFLTNLPNRLQFLDRLAHAIALAARSPRKLAVLFLDLDRFKTINDSLGHAVGDLVLQSVSQRLSACVRNADTVSRQGGDEFVLLLTQIEHHEDAAGVAAKILAALAPPHAIGERTLYIGASVGISMYPCDGTDADLLIRHADTAMYFAKQHGRNQYQFFRASMSQHALERQFIESNLRRALDLQQFILHYQPKIDLVSGAVSGVEALIRWQHPERGLVGPDSFIEIAEQCGLILRIDDWVLTQACRQARCWHDAGYCFGRIAVNLSATEFHRGDLLERVRNALLRSRLPPHLLELDLTEGVFVDDAGSVITLLQQLRELGVQLTIDDFGTGYSSLSYLRRLPVDVLKIDQSFLRNVTSDPDAATILKAVIDIGLGLQQQVIAEGVETEEQFRYLQRNNCRDGQGYFFSRPVPAEAFTRLLAQHDTAPT